MTAPRPLAVLAALALFASPDAQARQDGFVPLGPVEPRLTALERRIDYRLKGTRGELVARVAADAGLSLVFAADLPGLDAPVDRAAGGARARQILAALLDGTELELRIARDGRAVLTRRARRPTTDTVPAAVLYRGIVVDSVSGAPIGYARISAGERSNQAGPGGRFEFRGPVGVALTLRALGYRPRAVDARGEPGDTVVLGLVPLAREPLRLADVVVSPSTFSTATMAVSAQTLDREALERTTQIGEDAFRAINRLPGIENNDNTSAFRVRGGPHDEIFVSLDGLTLLEPFHLKDFDNALSILDPQVVGGVELVTGGFGPRYGDRLTGVMTFSSVDRLPGREQRQLGLSIAAVRALASGGFSGDKGSWLGTVRRGYLDLVLALADPSSVARPRYLDAFGKVTYRLSDAWTLSLHGLAARDGLSYQENDRKPRIESRYGNAYGWARLRTTGTGRWRADLVTSFGHLSWTRLGTRISDFDGQADLGVDDHRRYTVFTSRVDAGLDATPWLVLSAGAEGRVGDADYDYRSWQRSFASTTTGLEMRFDSTRVDRQIGGTGLGGYLAARVRPVAGVVLELGGRVDRRTETAETLATPTLQTVWSPFERLTLRGAWGRYSQGQGLHRLQVQDGIDSLGASERSEHRVLGGDLMLDGRHDLRVEVYERRYDRVRPRFVNLDGSQEVFPELNSDRFLLAPDRSQVNGMELSLRGFEREVTWTASYCWQRARDHVGETWVAREFDQRHALSLDVGWQATRRLYLSGAFVAHSGWPYTTAAFVAKTLPDGSVVLGRSLGPLNAERLRSYQRLDFRATRDFPVSRGRIRGFLELFNVLGRRNQRGFTHVPVFTNEGSLAGTLAEDEDLYTRLVSFGVYWAF